MRNATQRQLRVFEAVARQHSYSRAAEELHLSQPAVSAQVRQLEGHAGVPLFEVLGKKTFLTAAGADLLVHVRAVLDQLRLAGETMERHAGGAGGELRVAVISAGDYFFPQLLADFRRLHPGVGLQLGVHNREGLLRQLADNLTDLAVMVRPPPDRDLVREAFAPHPYVIVAPPGHRLAKRRRIPVSELLEEPFLMRERGSDTWNSMQEAFRGRFSRVRCAMELGSMETIKQAVISGMGIAFLSAHTIRLELRLGLLTVLDVVGFPSEQHWYVVHRKGKALSPVARAFKSYLREEGAGMLARLFER
jgi:DNA-binding transcriptional LysR family regulator